MNMGLVVRIRVWPQNSRETFASGFVNGLQKFSLGSIGSPVLFDRNYGSISHLKFREVYGLAQRMLGQLAIRLVVSPAALITRATSQASYVHTQAFLCFWQNIFDKPARQNLSEFAAHCHRNSKSCFAFSVVHPGNNNRITYATCGVAICSSIY